MKRTTVFSTPLITPILRLLAVMGLRLTGWKIANQPPAIDKYVLIGAPHTSNWDFLLMLAVVLKVKLQVNWMGKHTLFPPLLRGVMQWLAGIMINRDKTSNVVQQMAAHYQQADQLVVLLAPEGTRSPQPQWKTGFYYMALEANVPVVLGWMDYAQKIAGFGPAFYPTGDIASDMAKIQAFYANIKGCHPENFAITDANDSDK